MDIEKIRDSTPGCHDKLFMNSAGSSLPPRVVNQKISMYLEKEELMGGYQLANESEEEIQGFYDEVAKLIQAKAENIAFTSNATDSFARALSAIPFKKGDVVLTTDDDYVSNFFQFISLKNRYGIEIIRAGCLENGDLDLQGFRKLLEEYSPKLVAITHIPTGSGKIQPAEDVGILCKEFNCLYLLDACQSAGQIPLDVTQIQCDFLSVTGRKFLRGPRGTGFLYISDRVLQQDLAPLTLDLRGATWTGEESYQLDGSARRFELWEMPYALLLGFKEAVAYANMQGVDTIQKYNSELHVRMRSRLSTMKEVELYDEGTRLSSIITFRKKNKEMTEHLQMLRKNKVFFSVASKESSLLDYRKKGIHEVIRLSPHYFNTPEEIDQLCDIIERI
jgi:selenocysteine lyase/cysteine desulfurase